MARCSTPFPSFDVFGFSTFTRVGPPARRPRSLDGVVIPFPHAAITMSSAGRNTTADRSQESQPATRWWRSWLRLPSFAVACSITIFVWLAYLCWLILDAQYQMTLFVVRFHVGLEQLDPHPLVVAYGFWDMMWDGVRSWGSLGPRLLLFAVLAIAAAASSLLMVVQFMRRATIRRWLVVVFVISAWLSFWVSYGQLHQWAVLRRAEIALPRFKSTAISLSQHWPTENGTLPEAGVFYAYPDKHPNLLLLHGRRGYPVREDFGYQIERSEHGAIRFNLSGATDCQIEFHPNGSEAASYTTSLDSRMTLRQAIPLGGNQWYLVRYGES